MSLLRAGVGGPLDAVAAGGGGGTAFDPAHKSSAIALSGSNLIATSSASSNWEAVRATASHSSGKYYAEFTVTTLPSPNVEMGIVNASFPFVTGDFIGFDANSCGYADNGGVFQNGGSILSSIAYGLGDVVQMAYDAGTGGIWFAKGGGIWNNSGAANPATATGGLASGLGGQTVFAAAAVFANGQVWTANFGGSAYSFTAPSGFGNW